MLEGVAFSLRHVLEECEKAAGSIRTELVHLSGGGGRSSHWCQIKADVLNVPVRLAMQDSGLLGAAILSGVGTGLFESVSSAAPKM